MKKQMNLVLIGRTGNGKSATGNFLLNKHVFRTSCSSRSETKCVQQDQVDFDRAIINVFDTPGLHDTDTDDNARKSRTAKHAQTILRRCHGGIDAFLHVIKFGERFTGEEISTLDTLEQIYGDTFYNHVIVIITGGDLFQDAMNEEDSSISFQEWCSNQSERLQELYERCHGRFLMVNNKEKNEEKKKEQVEQIVQLVEQIQIKHGRYTLAQFRYIEQERKKMVQTEKVASFLGGLRWPTTATKKRSQRSLYGEKIGRRWQGKVNKKVNKPGRGLLKLPGRSARTSRAASQMRREKLVKKNSRWSVKKLVKNISRWNVKKLTCNFGFFVMELFTVSLKKRKSSFHLTVNSVFENFNMWMQIILLVSFLCPSKAYPRHVCHPGTYLVTARNDLDFCPPCTDGVNFMPDSWHTHRNCYNCTQIRDQDLEILVTECTRTHDAEILCTPGYYRKKTREDINADTCEVCSECSDFVARVCEGYTDVVCCPDQSYEAVKNKDTGYICEKRCGTGHFLYQEKKQCRPCPSGTFMADNKHNNTTCKPCQTLSDLGPNQIILQDCNSTHPSIIGCKDGYFRNSSEEMLSLKIICLQCQKCEHQGRECDMYHNTVCCDDPYMTVLDTVLGPECRPADQSQYPTPSLDAAKTLGEHQTKTGNDTVCGEGQCESTSSQDNILTHVTSHIEVENRNTRTTFKNNTDDGKHDSYDTFAVQNIPLLVKVLVFILSLSATAGLIVVGAVRYCQRKSLPMRWMVICALLHMTIMPLICLLTITQVYTLYLHTCTGVVYVVLYVICSGRRSRHISQDEPLQTENNCDRNSNNQEITIEDSGYHDISLLNTNENDNGCDEMII